MTVIVISDCHKTSTNTEGREDTVLINDVISWNDCGARCLGNPNCKFWTWHNDKAGEFAHLCLLMSGYSNTNDDGATVSGPRGCPASGK